MILPILSYVNMMGEIVAWMKLMPLFVKIAYVTWTELSTLVLFKTLAQLDRGQETDTVTMKITTKLAILMMEIAAWIL